MTDTITAGELADMLNSDIPTPNGATGVDNWMLWDDNIWMRCFDVQTYRDGKVIVYLGGHQDTTGEVTYTVDLERSDSYTAAEARALAEMLTKAADKIDQLTGDAPPFM